MAWLNDSTPPASSSQKGKESACTEPAEWIELDEPKSIESNHRVNWPEWRDSILIDGGGDKSEQHEITHELFLKECQKRPEWLYEKLLQMHEQYNNEVYDCEDHLSAACITGQARNAALAQSQECITELEECLGLASADCDIYAN